MSQACDSMYWESHLTGDTFSRIIASEYIRQQINISLQTQKSVHFGYFFIT